MIILALKAIEAAMLSVFIRDGMSFKNLMRDRKFISLN
jgi:hypothetical protein